MPSVALQPDLSLRSDLAALADRKSGFASSQASLLLDVVRGLAAIFVLLGHWRNLFFVDYSDIPGHRGFFAIPYLCTSIGHQAVIIFFVLSGYLISGSVFRMFKKTAWSWKTYLLHRLVRLWIVLVPGLAIAAVCDSIGLHLTRTPATILYHGLSGDHVTGNVAAAFHPSIWFGNLFFLQTTFFPIFGSDSPLWSLANEFWYYMLFPLGFLALRRQTGVLTRAVCVVLSVAIAYRVERSILILFPVWLMGTLMAYLPVPRVAGVWRLLAVLLYVPVVLYFAKLHTGHPLAGDLIFGIFTLGFLYLLLSAQAGTDEHRVSTRSWRTLARFSFTLYVVHLPILTLIDGLVTTGNRWPPDLPHLALAGLFLAGTVAFAFGLACLTEFRTDSVRKAIERRLA